MANTIYFKAVSFEDFCKFSKDFTNGCYSPFLRGRIYISDGGYFCGRSRIGGESLDSHYIPDPIELGGWYGYEQDPAAVYQFISCSGNKLVATPLDEGSKFDIEITLAGDLETCSYLEWFLLEGYTPLAIQDLALARP